jgi:phosphatidylglycerophosphatase A
MKAARLIASGLGTGFAPVAPGTAGSLLGLALGAACLALSPWALAAFTAAATAAGLLAIVHAGTTHDPGTKDPGWIVIDEIAGQSLTLLALPRPTALGLLAAFALFRLFDIAKPGPIGWADRRTGPAAVMADDLLAGLAAACIVRVLHLLGRGWV